MSKFVVILAAISILLAMEKVSSHQILTSPLLTNWGTWGAWETCPPGSKVIQVQIKTQRWDWWDVVVDDTCQNGIKFMCGDPSSGVIRHIITSKQGQWGSWGRAFACNTNSYMVGFMTRVVEGNTATVDETSMNNFRILCSGAPGFSELDGERWGEWTNPRICANTEYICGLQTQVEDSQGAFTDDTSLNNLKIECCDLPSQELAQSGPWNYTGGV